MLIALAGVAERWILYVRAGRTNSDESLSGLMAAQVWHGHLSLFLWGQNDGGTIEVFPVALVTRLFPSSLLAERFTTLVLSAVCAVLVGVVAGRIGGRWAGLGAGAVLWLWPVYFVQWSSLEYLYYVPVVALALGAAVLAVRSTRRPAEIVSPLAVGLLLGVGWWTNPNVAVYVPLVAGLALQSGGHRLRRVALGAAGAVVGAAPWIVFNVQHHLASLSAGPLNSHGTYRNRLSELFHVGIPVDLGLREVDGLWSASWAPAAYDLFLVAGGLVAVRTVILWARGRMSFPADVLAVAAYPFIYAASPLVSTAAVYTPRYFFFAWPLVALMFARGIAALSNGDLRSIDQWRHAARAPRAGSGLRWRRAVLAPAVVLAAVAVLAGVAIDKEVRLVRAGPPLGLTAAGDNLHLTAITLERHGVNRVFTSYWTAYVLDQVADGRVIATPAAEPVARYKPWDRVVRTSPDPAWLVVPGSIKASTLLAWLGAQHIPAQTFMAAGYEVIVPVRRVLPEEVPAVVAANPTEGP